LKNGFEPIYHFAKGEKVRFRPHNMGHPGIVPDPQSPIHYHTGTGPYYHSRVNNIEGTALPDNVVDLRGTDRGIDHPAIFPVALPSFIYEIFSDSGDLWVDPFLGSGTSIVAAHRTARRCYGVDNSPAYCELALRRAEAEGISPVQLIDRKEGH